MIVAENLFLAFADSGGRSFTVLDVPRFEPEAGKITAIRGASGSGKSTLLYVLAGLLPPQRGTVRFGGADIYALTEGRRDAWRRRRVGFIFQDFHLVPELSPLANVTLPGTFGRTPGIKARGQALLAQLGVPAARGTVEKLSRGERQRVAIARALLFDAPVILADEPTASLDAGAAADLIGILKGLAAEGRTVVVASHDRDVVAAANSVLGLDHGRLVPAAMAA